MTSNLLELAARCEAATGPDRELDAKIAEQAFGWKRTFISADYNGENAGEILTQDGKLPEGFGYPPIGKIPLWFHVPQYTRDCRDPELPRDAIRRHYAAALRARADGASHE